MKLDLQDQCQDQRKNLSTEAIQQAVNYISGVLGSMQIAHTIGCYKDKMVLLKMSKPPTIAE
jgi:hypothetical protein